MAALGQVEDEEARKIMDRMDSPMMKSHTADRLDAAFSEFSRAVGPMFLVFSVTAVGWILVHAL